MKKIGMFSLLALAGFFSACGDSSSSAGTSCTVKDNNDNSYTLSCPDGTSAIIRNGADGKDGAGSLASISLSNKEPQGYASPLTIDVSDFDLISQTDSVKIHVTSTSNVTGIDLWAVKSGVKYSVDLYFSSTQESSKLFVKNGDLVTISYNDPNPETTVSEKVNWSNYTTSSKGTLAFDKKQYLGDGSLATIVLTDADLAGEKEVSIALCIGVSGTASCPMLHMNGSDGVFSAQIKLSTTASDISTNTFKVANGDHLLIMYRDASPAENIQAEADFFTARQGYVQFGQDIWNMLESVSLYVYDEDNLDSVAELTLTSDVNRTGVKIHLPRYSNGVFYGFAKLSLEKPGTDTVLQVKDGGSVYATYFDSSTGVSKSDQSKLSLMKYVRLTFGDSVYYGFEDKAVITLNDYFQGMSPALVHMWSDSDMYGRNLELHYYGTSIGYMQVGFIEFTDKTPYEGQLKVSDGDKIYIEYTSQSDSTVRDTAVWRR